MSAIQRPETLTSAVMKYVMDAIIHGEFAPGTQLPELTLAEKLEVSRGTVREALRSVADSGLVEVRPHRGVFVSDLTPRRAEETYRLRMLLEPYAASRAAERCQQDPGAARRLSEAFLKLQTAADDDPIASVDADTALHQCITELAGNEMLVEVLSSLRVQTKRFIVFTKLFQSDAATEVAAHKPVVEAILAGDAEGAAQAMRDHILESGQLLVNKMKSLAPAGDGVKGWGR
jgi:DNA-binding GntR family transcriptional regulator